MLKNLRDLRIRIIITDRGKGRDEYFKKRLKKDFGVVTTAYLGYFKSYSQVLEMFEPIIKDLKAQSIKDRDEWEGR